MNDLPNNFGKADLCELACTNMINTEHFKLCSFEWKQIEQLYYETMKKWKQR